MEITVNGLKVRYEITGTGRDVLLLHGWGSSLDAFRLIRENLSANFRVTALDFPGFGGSDMPPEPWSVGDYAQFTLSFIKAVGIDKPVLVGHSFGGRVIIKLTGTKMIETDKIILIDSAGVKHKKKFKSKFKICAFKTVKAVLSCPLWKKHTANILDSARSLFGSADYNSAPPILRQTLVKAVNEDLCCYMPDISASTLLIWGENDTDTPVSDARTMERLIPDAGLCIIKNASHFSFIQRPYEVNMIINSFLGDK